MYYYVILCSGYRTSNWATDRFSCTRSINAPTHVARVLIHARYGFNPRHAVGQGASEASGALGMTAFSADYQSVEPCACRESLETREQLTQARALVRRPRWGNVSLARRLYTSSDIFAKILRHLSTIEHKLEQSFIG